MTSVSSAAAAALPVFCGWLVWCRIGARGPALRREAFSYALPTAVVVVGLEMLLLSLLAPRYTRASLLVPLVVLGGLCAIPWRPFRDSAAPAAGAGPGWIGWLALAVIAAEIALVVCEVVASPTIGDWDAWAIWGMKAKAFFVDGTVRGYLAAAHDYEFSWPARPCLSSLYQAFVYTALGSADEAAARLAHVALWVALLLVFHADLRSRFSADRALVWTAVLATVPNVTYQASAGVGNVLLGLYLFATVSALRGWHATSRAGPLAGGALMLAGAFLARDEGRLLGSASVVAVFFLGPWFGTAPGFRRRLVAALSVWLAAAGAYGLWALLLASAPTPVSGEVFLLQPGIVRRLWEHLPDVPAILAACGRELAWSSEQHRASSLEGVLGVSLLWPLFALSTAAAVRLHRTDAVGFRCLAVVWFGLSAYTMAFVLFPYVDLPDLTGNWVFVLDRHAVALAPMAVRVIASAFTSGDIERE